MSEILWNALCKSKIPTQYDNTADRVRKEITDIWNSLSPLVRKQIEGVVHNSGENVLTELSYIDYNLYQAAIGIRTLEILASSTACSKTVVTYNKSGPAVSARSSEVMASAKTDAKNSTIFEKISKKPPNDWFGSEIIYNKSGNAWLVDVCKDLFKL